MRADGTTSGGCWIYTGVFAGGVNRSANRVPGREQGPVAPDWGWAWPANRRILYNRASADPEGRPWSERKKYVWWDDEQQRWTGYDVPDFPATKPPSYRPEPGTGGPEGLAGDDPFIMQADGKAWLFAPRGMIDGPLPTHYEPQESPVANPLYRQQANPARKVFARKDNLWSPSAGEPGTEVYPYVFTTYRLTEHHTAGGMSRWLPYLAELQPEFFCEVSPELAQEKGLENGGWATIVSARTAVEARVLVTERMTPLVIGGRTVHQIGLPYHWGVGREAVVSRRLRQRPAGCGARPQRADPGVQGRAPATSCRGGAREVRRCCVWCRSTSRAPGSRCRRATRCGRRRASADGVLETAARRAHRPGARRGLGRPAAAQGLLHRHLHLHRLQGL